MIYWLPLLAFILFVVDYRITAGNMNVRWNGFGCVHDVVYGRAVLPMQNRVFVPYLTWVVGGFVVRRWAYLLVKYFGILFALFGSHYFLSSIGVNAALGTVLMAALMPLMMLYDYADSYWEMGFFTVIFGMLIQGADIWIIIPILIMAILNRESGAIIAVMAVFGMALSVRIGILVTCVAVVCLMMLVNRDIKRYCPLNLIKTNLLRWKHDKLHLLSGYNHSLILIAIFIGLSVGKWGVLPALNPIIITMAVFTVLMIVPSMWNETRVFAPLLTVIVPLMII